MGHAVATFLLSLILTAAFGFAMLAATVLILDMHFDWQRADDEYLDELRRDG